MKPLLLALVCLCGCKPVEEPKSVHIESGTDAAYLEHVEPISEWQQGYDEGDGRGFQTGVICAVGAMRSMNHDPTNMLELISESRKYLTNAQALAKQMGQ